MEKLKDIHVRMSEEDMKIINKIIDHEQEYYEIVIHMKYGYTDAIKQGLNLLYDMLINQKYRLVPNNEEENTKSIEQDKSQ